MPGVFQDHLLPVLQTRHKAALAATCRQLREQVQQTVNKLNLHAGRCCLVHTDKIAPKLPNISELSLKPGNLHEAMYVLPIFFMQDACRLSGITSLQLLDQLPDRPPDRIQCGSCLAFTSTYDLSAILVTAGKCMPHLAALDFSTHYISDAECAAISLMTGLTRLQLRSTHGTKSGGIAHFTSLEKLADLRLLDSNLERFTLAGDLAMLLGRSCMTQLQIRYHPILVPAMLSALVEMQDLIDEVALTAAAGPTGSRTATASGPAGAAAAATAASPTAAASPSNSLAYSAAAVTGGTHFPPPLCSLSIVLSPYMRGAADAVRHAAKLTNLTRLSLGWYARLGHLAADEAADEVIPQAVQKQLSQLVGLQELAVGWPVGYAVLTALASLTSLTKLHLGCLPAKKPPPGLHFPSVKQLILHLKHTMLYPGDDVPDWVAEQHRDLVEGLAAFPSVTALELTGDIPAHTLAHLPSVAPSGLQQLLLPQRMMAPARQDLAQLRLLTGLTTLRIGWKAALHDGPPSLPDEDLPEPIIPIIQAPANATADVQSAPGGPGTAAAYLCSGWEASSLPRVVSLAALTELRGLQLSRPATVPVAMTDANQHRFTQAAEQPRPLSSLRTAAAAVADATCCSSSRAPGLLQGSAATAPSASGPTGVAKAADATSAMGVKQQSCSVCGALLKDGCLCRLRRLELVGPVTLAELKHLTGLPALHTLVIRNNVAWSSGLPYTGLGQLIIDCTSLRRLEVFGCPEVDGLVLEQFISASQPERLSCVDIVVQEGGKSAAELGMGHQFIGDVFSPAQERGDDEVLWWGGTQSEAEQAADAAAVIGPQPNPNEPPAQAHVHAAVLQVNGLLGQLQHLNDVLAGNQQQLQEPQQANAAQHMVDELNGDMQALAGLLQGVLEQNQLVHGLAQQMQQLQNMMSHQMLVLVGQLQQLGAIAGNGLPPHVLQLAAQLQQAVLLLEPDDADAEGMNEEIQEPAEAGGADA